MGSRAIAYGAREIGGLVWDEVKRIAKANASLCYAHPLIDVVPLYRHGRVNRNTLVGTLQLRHGGRAKK